MLAAGAGRGVVVVTGTNGKTTTARLIRLQYGQGRQKDNVELIVIPELHSAIATALQCTKPGELLHVLPTYSAMLEVRQELLGRGIL